MGFRSRVSEHPDKPAIIMAESGATVTFGALSEQADRYANLFRALGLKAGDSIAFTLPNCPEFSAICIGALRTGLYYSAISTYLSAAETHYIVEDCGARLYVCSTRFRDVAEVVAGRLPAGVRCLSAGGDIAGYESLEAMLATMPATPVADETKGQDLLYSSGTTGKPKGVRIDLTGESPEELSINAQAVIALYEYSADTVYLSPAPLYHAAPLRFNLINLWQGGTSVILARFDAEAALAAVEKYRCTHSQWVPTMFVRMLKLPAKVRERYSVGSMRVAIHGAAPCPVGIKQRMIEWWGPVLHEYYAGTEGSGYCAVRSAEWLQRPGTVGRPLFGAVHIVGDDGGELPPGEIGTIYFSGGRNFQYLNDPEKTRAAHNDNGWSTLGDIGYVDEDGYVYLTDRLAYMIISGGVNVYPQEAEDILVMHPAVADAAVFGIPDPDMGEQVKAVVQLVDAAAASDDLATRLIDYCREHLSHIKCPRSVDFMAELPRHATGKLYKRLLRDPYWSGDAVAR